MVWCGVVWCGAVECGAVWFGVARIVGWWHPAAVDSTLDHTLRRKEFDYPLKKGVGQKVVEYDMGKRVLFKLNGRQLGSQEQS